MAKLKPQPSAAKQIAELQALVANLESQRNAALQERDQYDSTLQTTRASLAEAQANWTATAKQRDDYAKRLVETQAKLDAAQGVAAKERLDILNRADRDLIACQAELERVENDLWAARGGIYLLLSEQKQTPVDKIPEADVKAVCQRWEARFK